MHKDLLNYVNDNEVVMGQEISNHDLVFIKIMVKNLPYCRKRLWKLPGEMMKNKKFRDTSEKRLRACLVPGNHPGILCNLEIHLFSKF